MKVLKTARLPIDGIEIVRFARFTDHRGYFTEQYRKSDFAQLNVSSSLRNASIVQCNESYSQRGTIRGMHFQWNPYMGKLVRTVFGHMVDMVLDIRVGSPTYGKAIMYDMAAGREEAFSEWIWVPPGFAHGNFFLNNTTIEYYCTGEYSPDCEAGISPLASDIDWSLCDSILKQQFDSLLQDNPFISDKDRGGLTVKQWTDDERSKNFEVINFT